MPIFLRSERGARERASLERKLKMNRLGVKLRNARTDRANTRERIRMLRNNVANRKALLEAEQRSYRTGESAFFMVNQRESKYIKSNVALLGSFARYEVALLRERFYRGTLHEIK